MLKACNFSILFNKKRLDFQVGVNYALLLGHPSYLLSRRFVTTYLTLISLSS